DQPAADRLAELDAGPGADGRDRPAGRRAAGAAGHAPEHRRCASRPLRRSDMTNKLVHLLSHPVVAVVGLVAWAVGAFLLSAPVGHAAGVALLLAFSIASFLKRRATRKGRGAARGGGKGAVLSALRGLGLFLVIVAFLATWILLPWQGLLVVVLVLALWMTLTRSGRQAASVTWVGVATLRQRLGASSVVVIGIAGVVGVLVALLAM